MHGTLSYVPVVTPRSLGFNSIETQGSFARLSGPAAYALSAVSLYRKLQGPMSQPDMVSGTVPRYADQRVKSLAEAKAVTTQHTLKPGDPTSWQTFKGEFKSAIDAESLPALHRAKPYTIAECYEMLSTETRTEEDAAGLCMRLNGLYDAACDYLYRCLYKKSISPCHRMDRRCRT